jgi:transglutaminase-like putative cysteine protease
VHVEPSIERGVRRLKVVHANHYQYDQPITRSTHRVHLRPIHDRWQSVSSHTLRISPGADILEYEDAFGNWTCRFDIEAPYSTLSIVAESIVELRDLNPFEFAARPSRSVFPVHWMPWELKMLTPFLAPVELPEAQLSEIHEYATGFANRNRQDLLETLFDINLTLFREFKYVPQSTALETTPFDVLATKRVSERPE